MMSSKTPPACHTDHDSALKHREQPDKKRLISRLNRIEGQVRGIARMVGSDRYCVDILNQLAALRAAISGVSMQLLENHAHGCVAKAINAGEGEEAIEELMAVVKKLKA